MLDLAYLITRTFKSFDRIPSYLLIGKTCIHQEVSFYMEGVSTSKLDGISETLIEKGNRYMAKSKHFYQLKQTQIVLNKDYSLSNSP